MSETTERNPSLTVVVLTLNEERYLSRCLSSVAGLADQVLVLDSGSVDGTVDIAREHGAAVQQRDFDGYANQRNAALAMVDTEWVLFLDADEYLPDALSDEIRSVLAGSDSSVSGYRIPRENRYGARTLSGGGWWPDAQLRLFRMERARYDPAFQVHERLIVDGPTDVLKNSMVHQNFESFSEFRAIQRRYAIMQAEQYLQSGDTGRRRTILGRPVREFWRRFVSLGGYRDGALGLLLAGGMSWYEFKTWRMVRRRRGEVTAPAVDSVESDVELAEPEPSLDLSIVIVSYNTSGLLTRCLSSIEAWLEANSHTSEVIVVDNASTDGTAAMLERRYPEVRLIENRRNFGYAAANNQGIRAAKGRYIVLLNADTTVIGDAFGQLASFLDEHPDVGIVGPRLEYPDGTTQSSRRRFPTRLTGFLESTIIQDYWPDNRVVRRYYLQDRPEDRTQPVDWLVGACLMVRRDAIQSAGLLDERYFMYSEEVEWCHRLTRLGWRIMYLPAATVVHHEGASSSQNIPARQIHFDTSKVLLYRQLFGKPTAWSLHAFLLMSYLVRIGIEAGKGVIGHKRQMRWQRVALYTKVLVARIRRSGGMS